MILRRSPLALFAVSILLAACGGAAPAPAAPEGHDEHHAQHGEHGEPQEHASLSAPMKDYHDVLAPLWHAPKGPDRVQKTCAQAMALNDKAGALGASPPPVKGDAAAWKAEAGELSGACRALVAECEKEGRPQFEDRFAAVHEHFHKLVELSSAH